MGGERQREMAEAAESWRPALYDARRNREIYGPDARWHGPAIHVCDGGEIGGDVSFRRAEADRSGIPRNHGTGLVGTRPHRARGSFHRCRRRMARRGTQRATPPQSTYAVPVAVALGWRRSHRAIARHR